MSAEVGVGTVREAGGPAWDDAATRATLRAYRHRAWAIVAIGLALLVAFTVAANAVENRSGALRRSGVRIPGEVVAERPQGSNVRLLVAFDWRGGLHQAVVNLDSSRAGGYPPGEKVTVYADRSNPQVVTVNNEDNQSPTTVTPMIVALLVSVGMLITGVAMIVRARRQRRILRRYPWRLMRATTLVVPSGRSRLIVVALGQPGSPSAVVTVASTGPAPLSASGLTAANELEVAGAETGRVVLRRPGSAVLLSARPPRSRRARLASAPPALAMYPPPPAIQTSGPYISGGTQPTSPSWPGEPAQTDLAPFGDLVELPGPALATGEPTIAPGTRLLTGGSVAALAGLSLWLLWSNLAGWPAEAATYVLVPLAAGWLANSAWFALHRPRVAVGTRWVARRTGSHWRVVALEPATTLRVRRHLWRVPIGPKVAEFIPSPLQGRPVGIPLPWLPPESLDALRGQLTAIRVTPSGAEALGLLANVAELRRWRAYHTAGALYGGAAAVVLVVLRLVVATGVITVGSLQPVPADYYGPQPMHHSAQPLPSALYAVGGNEGAQLVTPHLALAVTAQLWTLRQDALSSLDPDELALVDEPGSEAAAADTTMVNLAAAGQVNPATIRHPYPLLNDTAILGDTSTYPLSVLGEVETLPPGSPPADTDVYLMVIIKDSPTTPWRVSLVTGYSPPPSGSPFFPSAPPSGNPVLPPATLPAILAHYWQHWLDHHRPPPNSPFLPGQWTTVLGSQLANQRTPSGGILNGSVTGTARVIHTYRPAYGPWIFPGPTGQPLVCTGITSEARYSAIHDTYLYQDPYRQDFEASLPPGLYSGVHLSAVHPTCILEIPGGRLLLIGGDAQDLPSTGTGV